MNDTTFDNNRKLKAKWKTESCGEPSCWCEMIFLQNCEYDSCVIGCGVLPKNIARHIVNIHNEYINSLQ